MAVMDHRFCGEHRPILALLERPRTSTWMQAAGGRASRYSLNPGARVLAVCLLSGRAQVAERECRRPGLEPAACRRTPG